MTDHRIPASPEADAARDRELRDIERTMLSIIQASISMIGFGFTIHAFLNGVDARAAADVDLDQVARRVGLALLSLGLLNLGWGMWNQYAYLRAVRGRHASAAMPGGYTPVTTFVIAFLLLAIGLAAFAGMFVQAIR
jgi:putative membrane protein